MLSPFCLRTLLPILLLSILAACGGGGGSDQGAGGSSSSSGGSVAATPVISQQPEASTTEAGTVAVFSVKADGAAPLSYQWRRQGIDIPGATHSSYAFQTKAGDNGSELSVLVSNAHGSTLSTTVRLQVSEQPGITLVAGQPGQNGMADGNVATALFSEPAGLARDALGNLFVSDSGNKVIRKISVDGTVSTLAGKAGESGSGDGIGLSARFSNPSDLSIDSAGNLYVLERGENSAIRKVTPSGQVTTVLRKNSYLDALAVSPQGGVIYAGTSTADCSQVYALSIDGIDSLVAGQSDSCDGFRGSDGIGDSAEIPRVSALAVSPSGIIYASASTFVSGGKATVSRRRLIQIDPLTRKKSTPFQYDMSCSYLGLGVPNAKPNCSEDRYAFFSLLANDLNQVIAVDNSAIASILRGAPSDSFVAVAGGSAGSSVRFGQLPGVLQPDMRGLIMDNEGSLYTTTQNTVIKIRIK